jgi:hypothetical protein
MNSVPFRTEGVVVTTPLNSQILSQAANATRALLERTLADTGLTYGHWATLRLTVDNPAIAREHLAGKLVNALKVTPDQASALIADLTTRDLLADQPHVRLSATGQATYDQLSTEVSTLTAHIYRDLPADDLATAGRLLTTITARANAELSGQRR